MKQILSVSLSGLVLLWFLAAPTGAGGTTPLPPDPLPAADIHKHRDIQNAQQLYQKGLQFLNPSPEEGKTSTRTAILLLKKAAEKQHPQAEFELGRVFFGHKAYKLALYWFQRVFKNRTEVFFKTKEEQSDLKARAAYYMGRCHLKARPPAPSMAFYELEFAAHQGVTKAFYELGQMYLKGQGVEKDLVLAVKWLSRAARGHDPEATEALNHLFQTQVSELNRPGRASSNKKSTPSSGQKTSPHCQSRF